MMQNALTPRLPSENGCFAGDAVEDTEETDTPLSSVFIGGRSLCNLRFTDDIDLLGSSEELQQLTERLEKTAAGYGMEIGCDRRKISSTALSQDDLPTYG